jgi:hypothetical protein
MLSEKSWHPLAAISLFLIISIVCTVCFDMGGSDSESDPQLAVEQTLQTVYTQFTAGAAENPSITYHSVLC